MSDPMATLPRKTRGLLEKQLAPGEEVIAVLSGLSKQALVATWDRLILIKPGTMAGAAFGAKLTTFSYANVTGLHIHAGAVRAAIEVLSAGYPPVPAHLLEKAHEIPNCLPCGKRTAQSPVIGQLSRFIEAKRQVPGTT